MQVEERLVALMIIVDIIDDGVWDSSIKVALLVCSGLALWAVLIEDLFEV